eukprot:COSAG02_NODE_1878_length_10554_cov_95.091918_11_plen_111_part_00
MASLHVVTNSSVCESQLASATQGRAQYGTIWAACAQYGTLRIGVAAARERNISTSILLYTTRIVVGSTKNELIHMGEGDHTARVYNTNYYLSLLWGGHRPRSGTLSQFDC